MPEIDALHEQYRRTIGLQINRQDNHNPTRRCFDRYIKSLADTPGLHSDNAQRQTLAPALLQLMACLSNARPALEMPVISTPTPREAQSLIPQLSSVSEAPLLLPEPVRHRHAVEEPAGKANNPPVTLLAKQDLEQLIFDEQRKQIDRLLQKAEPGKINSSAQRLNKLVNYLQSGAAEKKINTVAGGLIRTAGGYYTNRRHVIPESWKMAAMTDFMLHETLGMPFDQWLRLLNTFNHGEVAQALTNIPGLDENARRYFRDTVLRNVLPVAALELSATENETLRQLDISQPEWGFLHAGALLLSESGASLSGLTLAEIQEVGILLDTLLRNGSVPGEYAEYFRLPAQLYHKSSRHAAADQNSHQMLQDYFAHTQSWLKENDPLLKLNELTKSWKTRRELALDLLAQHQVSERWLYDWLNLHAPLYAPGRNGHVELPNIDDVFDEQNKKLAQARQKVEQLLLSGAFEALSQSEQQFIMAAKVERVSAEFNAQSALYGVPLPPQARMAMTQSGALIFPIPGEVELIRCTSGAEVRIYVLQESTHSGWKFDRVDDDREKLLDLLPDKRIPAADEDYKLKFLAPVPLKEASEPQNKIILQLTQLRYNKLFKALGHAGYEKTSREKAQDFLLSLIPFYTCISESINGNPQEAIPACAMDVVSLLPFAGAALTTTTRFGIALSRAASLALRYSAQQAGLQQLVRKSGGAFIKQFSTIAQEISPHVMRELGVSFISAVDPGFNLLALAGSRGINALESIIAQVAPRHQGIERLASILPQSMPVRSVGNLNIKSIYSQLHGRDLTVTLTGRERGVPIWVRINAQTGERFGRKYIRNEIGFLEPAPIKLANRLYQLKTIGLGGGSSKSAAELWVKSSARAGSEILIPSKATDYKDYTITEYNLKLPVGQKELIIIAHGRLRSRFRKVADLPSDLYFYTELNSDLESSNSEIMQFQTRRITLTPQEIVASGAETRDYDLQHAKGPLEDTYAKFRYHSRFLNSDIVAGSQHGQPLHDVLVIKKHHTLSLAKLVKELPPYSKIHCLFCRTRAMP